ncbi:MAG TPA: tetratricopeptide repeat protein [Blastocatellia bacterium]|nr:tetratricopeptide repeat protein [Blastocatellia bacterium]
MKTIRTRIALVALAVFFAVSASPALAKDKWIQLTTKNLNVVSNAGEDETRDIALKLEQFHFIFTRLFSLNTDNFLPVTVIVFKNDSSFKAFKPLYNGKPANVAGYFQPSPDENLIALTSSGYSEEHPLAAIYHEYTHLLNSYAPRQWPIWLGEGLAELYSTFDVKKKDVTLGMPVSNHVHLLRDNNFIPLTTLFNVGHDSPIYNERSKQGIFYAESWALMHYLVYGNNAARQPQLINFIRLIYQGMEVEPAFKQAFQTDTATMEKELRRYIGKDSYPGMIYTLSAVDGEKDIAVRPLSDAEVQFHLGNLLMRTQRLDEAETYLKQAIALDPNLARPYEGLGFVEMRRDHFDKSLEYFKQAATRDSKNFFAHYYYAEALQHEAKGAINADTAAKMSNELRAAIKLRPQFAQAHYMLAFVIQASNGDLQEGLTAMQTALRLAPQNKHYLLGLAQIQMRMNNFAAAKKTLAPLLASDDQEGVKTAAQSMMQYIEYQTAPRPEPRLREERTDATAPAVSREDSEPAPQLKQVTGRPTLTIAGTQVVRGVLTYIECANGKMQILLNTADSLLRFDVSDVTKLQFYSQDSSFDGSVGCGKVLHTAYVYYKPLTGNKAKLAGDAVAVEFAK